MLENNNNNNNNSNNENKENKPKVSSLLGNNKNHQTIPEPKRYMFEMVQPWKTYIFSSDSSQQMHEWMRWLKNYAIGRRVFSGWLTKLGNIFCKKKKKQ